jgi:hypothetical protein
MGRRVVLSLHPHVAHVKLLTGFRSNLILGTCTKDCRANIMTSYGWNTTATLHEVQLTSWSTVLEKSIVAQLVKNFSVFYGPRRLITVFTKALHRSLSWTRWTQFTPSHPISTRPILNRLPSKPRSSKWYIPFRLSNQNFVWISHLPHACRMPLPSHSPPFDHTS